MNLGGKNKTVQLLSVPMPMMSTNMTGGGYDLHSLHMKSLDVAKVMNFDIVLSVTSYIRRKFSFCGRGTF